MKQPEPALAKHFLAREVLNSDPSILALVSLVGLYSAEQLLSQRSHPESPVLLPVKLFIPVGCIKLL